MTKGLVLARLFYLAGHNVIGADFEDAFIPSTSGRYSKSLKAFYRLEKPDGSNGASAAYVKSLLDIIQKEDVNLWVSCSGVASAVEDGRAKETIELVTRCKAIQFSVPMTKILHEKHSFMAFTASIGLQIPESHHVTSHDDALAILSDTSLKGAEFIMKYTGTDDSVRANMTRLPFASHDDTEAYVRRLPISKSRPWLLQRFISGPEYCTHALIINNKVLAFTACPSSELLMHYTALSPESALCRSMLKFTQHFASSCPEGFTGHLSFDFMVKQESADAARGGLVDEVPIWPIECNPRAHTAVALFANTLDIVDEGYMTIFEDQPSSPDVDGRGQRRLNGSKQPEPIYPRRPSSYYWAPHDFVTLVIQPLIAFFAASGPSFTEVLDSLCEFFVHLTSWRDGTYVLWDPLPAWVLWHISWPWVFLSSMLTGQKWSRINVSTMKVFGC